ncbi:GGDEF domain-containing protein [Simplicispira psychrophila]|uniref:GGDEF domain-containing protein n=1 Tax=Simplicispira psychrophila TaxID=80882 RepID=UPI000480FCC3|nr:GGDEF domain-containing protein [Simplicispira psychrophila]
MRWLKLSVMPRKRNTQTLATARLLRALRLENQRLRAELTAQKRALPTSWALSEPPRSADSAHAGLLLAANERLLMTALDADALSDDHALQIELLTRTSQRDALTGTPTRAVMADRLDKAIGMARRHGLRTALLFVDLDDFKSINDQLGHLAGDEVLQLVARRLESGVRDSDTVSRHGGDEFLVLLAELSHASDAAAIATKMLAAVAEPVCVAGRELVISVSVGIAVYPEDGEDALTLMAKADEAMYCAKKNRHGSFVFYRKPPCLQLLIVPGGAAHR